MRVLTLRAKHSDKSELEELSIVVVSSTSFSISRRVLSHVKKKKSEVLQSRLFSHHVINVEGILPNIRHVVSRDVPRL